MQPLFYGVNNNLNTVILNAVVLSLQEKDYGQHFGCMVGNLMTRLILWNQKEKNETSSMWIFIVRMHVIKLKCHHLTIRNHGENG